MNPELKNIFTEARVGYVCLGGMFTLQNTGISRFEGRVVTPLLVSRATCYQMCS